jgi:adenosylcobinamide-phosphate synthase
VVTPARRRALAVVTALLTDAAIGEPPVQPHPVAAFGALMTDVESRYYADRRVRGVLHGLAGAAIGLAAGAATGSTALATYLAVAGRALGDEAGAVRALVEAGDLDGARARLPALVGRDPARLDGGDIARAVVESVAENTVDAVVAPALWGFVAGAPGAFAYRAVNTLDAMVGHRNARYANYGWASARLDDAANWVPARITVALVAAVRPWRAASVWRAVRGGAAAHPSPNAGFAEAAWAGALGVQLGGRNSYGGETDDRPLLGGGRPPHAADIGPAVALSRDVTAALAALLVVAAGRGRDR